MNPQINFGDLIKIGQHTLLCGDASERAMLAVLLGNRQPVLMVTDPPYGVNFAYVVRWRVIEGKTLSG